MYSGTTERYKGNVEQRGREAEYTCFGERQPVGTECGRRFRLRWANRRNKDYRLGAIAQSYKLVQQSRRSAGCARRTRRLIGGTNRVANCDPRSRINFHEPASALPADTAYMRHAPAVVPRTSSHTTFDFSWDRKRRYLVSCKL